MRFTPALLIVTLLLMGCAHRKSSKPAAVDRIAFGSCCRQGQPQPIWESIAAADPDLFILLGDNVYGDTEDMSVLRKKYDQLAAEPGFQDLRASSTLLATWDDHDMGRNDAGADYVPRAQSKSELFRFLDEPASSPRRSRGGVYASYMFGDPGRRVQVILLDTRSFRSPLRRDTDAKGARYVPDDDPAKTMLGERQWTWLADQLRQPADVRIIGSSIQVLSEEHPFEKWGNFPRERQRLLELIERSPARGEVVLLSGDRHSAEISRMDRSGAPPLYDVTASSLNAPLKARNPEPNRYRVDADKFWEPNFGLIEIDWSGRSPRLTLQVHDAAGEVVREQTVSLTANKRSRFDFLQ
jgi:alkaline phosphatase D